MQGHFCIRNKGNVKVGLSGFIYNRLFYKEFIGNIYIKEFSEYEYNGAKIYEFNNKNSKSTLHGEFYIDDYTFNQAAYRQGYIYANEDFSEIGIAVDMKRWAGLPSKDSLTSENKFMELQKER